MTRLRLFAAILAVAMVGAACTASAEPTTTVPQAPPSTQAAPTTTTVPPPTTSAPVTTTSPPVDAWAITVVPVNDYVGADMAFGIDEILSATAMIRATIVTIGDPETGRWCCENPPFQVSDIEVIGGEFTDEADGWLNGVEYQSLDKNITIGSRVTMLVRNGVATFVFENDEGLAHPAPQHQADAIDAMRVREAQSAGGWDPLDYSPLRAVTDIWGRYNSDWWGPIDHRVALALSGVPGYPTVCSAADLGPRLASIEYPPAFEGLPSTVARSRDEIVGAATACDYDEILSLTTFVDGDDTDLFWWSGGQTSDILVEADRRFGAMRELVLALTNTAYASEEVNAENSSGEYVDQTFYMWPSASVLIDETNARTPAAETLGVEEAARVAALNRVTVEELDESIRFFPGYALFRTAIDAAGRWRFALSGD